MITSQNLLNGNLQSLRIFILVVASLFFVGSVLGQDNSGVDLNFNAVVSTNQVSQDMGPPYYIASVFIELQPDDKIIVHGNFNNIRGVAINTIARLNTDGTLDNSFRCNCEGFQAINSAVLQPDGKIIIIGKLSASSHRLARLNANGTVDGSFSSSVEQEQSNSATVWAVRPDGKIFVSTYAALISGNVTTLRLHNPDGSVDNSFFPLVFNENAGESLDNLKVLPGGETLINGKHPFGSIFRIDPNGTKSDSVSYNSLTPKKSENLPNDKILIEDALKANAVENSVVDSLGRTVYAGYFDENGTISQKIDRRNPDGSPDSTFSYAIFGLTGAVTAVLAQADGKVFIAGRFNRINGVPRKLLARVNTDGSLDTTFNAGDAFHERYTFAGRIVLQPDGKIIAGGTRLNTDGSVDTSFNLSFHQIIYAVALQPDGKILIGGTFTVINGMSRVGLARLNSDGSLDTAFNPILSHPAIYSIFVQPDGKIMIGGFFTKINNVNRSNFARLNADGSLDESFNPGSSFEVVQIAQTSEGKYLVITNTFRNISRRNADGTPDASFRVPTVAPLRGEEVFLNRFLLQSDGSIIILGRFGRINGFYRNSIARLRADGNLDTRYFPRGVNEVTHDDEVTYDIAAQADGKLVIGGNFSTVADVARSGVARVSSAPYPRAPLFDFDGDDKTDISIFRPSVGEWWYSRSSDGGNSAAQFGNSSDKIAPADFTGDGKTDIAVFRPSSGEWFILRSEDGSYYSFPFGTSGDIPTVGDFDGDGKADQAVFRPSDATWYIRRSSDGGFTIQQFGANGDAPAVADYDGDGKADIAIYRSSVGEWWIQKSSNASVIAFQFGNSADRPVPGDYTADSKADVAIWRPSTGEWFILRSENESYYSFPFGTTGDIPAPGDYDGDGRFDATVFRPSQSTWYVQRTTAGTLIQGFGMTGDKPVPNAFVP